MSEIERAGLPQDVPRVAEEPTSQTSEIIPAPKSQTERNNEQLRYFRLRYMFQQIAKEEGITLFKLVEAIGHSAHPKAAQLYEAFTQKKRKNKAPHDIARDVGMTSLQLRRFYFEGKKAMAEIKFNSRGSEELPKIGDGLWKYAQEQQQTCETCKGDGYIGYGKNKRKCPYCIGSGKRLVAPEVPRVELALKSLGIIKKEGTTVNVPVQLNVGTESLADVIKQRNEAIDSEVISGDSSSNQD